MNVIQAIPTKLLGVLLLLVAIVMTLFLVNDFLRKPTSYINTSRESVVQQVQSLGRLESASYTIEKIVEAGDDRGNTVQNFLFGDKLLLIANGKVIAGVDLSGLKQTDVVVSGTQISIQAPAPTIFQTSLDSTKTQVYDRSRGILNRDGKDLESEARAAAEQSIARAACDAGILEEARKNAISRLTQLFKFAGFTTVTVTIPPGSC